MSADNRNAQEEELCALKSIFDHEFEVVDQTSSTSSSSSSSSSSSFDPEGRYVAHVDLPSTFKVKWRDPKDLTTEVLKKLRVQHLPPVILSFSLPSGYPTEAAPDFALSCDWLNRDDVSKLCEKLFDLWREDRDVILYKWASFLKEELLQFLGIGDELDVSDLQKHSLSPEATGHVPTTMQMVAGKFLSVGRVDSEEEAKVDGLSQGGVSVSSEPATVAVRKRSGSSKCTLLKMLQEHNKQRLQEEFDKETFMCNVCYMTAMGSKCIQFQPCTHVFCKRCVKDYVEVAIREGRVQNLSCLELDCKSPVLQSHVKELVSNELFASYDQLLLTVSLTSMTDVTLCPFASCETAVLFDPEDNMASCPSCMYVFCIHCKMGYHGVEPCRIRAKDKIKLVRDYLAANGKAKEDLEKRYGKRPLQILVNNVMSQQWIDANSKRCPKCNTNIEKLDGCNKMQCWRCSSNFCWLCRKLITDQDPYAHFNSLNSECNGLLFHGLPQGYEFDLGQIEDDDDDSFDDDEFVFYDDY